MEWEYQGQEGSIFSLIDWRGEEKGNFCQCFALLILVMSSFLIFYSLSHPPSDAPFIILIPYPIYIDVFLITSITFPLPMFYFFFKFYE